MYSDTHVRDSEGATTLAESAATPTRAFMQSHGLDLSPTGFDAMVTEAIGSLQQSLYRPNPKADLTELEAEALERAGFVLEGEELGDRDPLARTIAEYAAILRTGLTTSAMAQRLGVEGSRVRQRLTSQPPSLYGIRLESEWRLPEFQLDGDRLLPGLGEVVANLDRELHPVTVFRWFTGPHPDLVNDIEGAGNLSPRDWLRLGFPPKRVAELAAEL